MPDGNSILGQNLEAPTVDQGFDEARFIAENIGEGKKFASMEEAVKALAKKAVHADNFIETVKNEKRQLETVYNETVAKLAEATTSGQKVDEILAALKAGGQSSSTPTGQSLSQEDLNKMLEETISKRDSERARKENEQRSWDLLAKEYGDLDKAKEAIRQFAKGDKAVIETIKILGSNNPEKLVEFVTAKKQTATQYTDGNQGAINIASLGIDNNGLTWDVAKKLKKENPKEFWSTKFQAALHKAASANPNFYK